ncbi:DUF6153 family protein [Amycolatopsis solani]|uniref:DUF6153 family protein n=1 Tax=Amycolatopsis solani TaxID=3028615 RepID=UPI0025B05CD9|nr:DUF6153 family protein [Amycolatopsis sp. MEP2-6]
MAARIGRVQQVILLCLLALGVTAMHHVSASGEPDSVAAMSVAASVPATDTGMGTGEHHEPGPGGAHEMLHLCLAILTVVGALFLAWLLLVRRPGTGTHARRKRLRGSPAPERPPDRPGRTILNSLCVLRV